MKNPDAYITPSLASMETSRHDSARCFAMPLDDGNTAIITVGGVRVTSPLEDPILFRPTGPEVNRAITELALSEDIGNMEDVTSGIPHRTFIRDTPRGASLHVTIFLMAPDHSVITPEDIAVRMILHHMASASPLPASS
jgi:hypothetical protein